MDNIHTFSSSLSWRLENSTWGIPPVPTLTAKSLFVFGRFWRNLKNKWLTEIPYRKLTLDEIKAGISKIYMPLISVVWGQILLPKHYFLSSKRQFKIKRTLFCQSIKHGRISPLTLIIHIFALYVSNREILLLCAFLYQPLLQLLTGQEFYHSTLFPTFQYQICIARSIALSV